ncbi:MAG: FAD-dependent oxidoreductase [Clostridia bacterium]|nr:FAD-dependent oxidoreductase [Clostridia bacterium]MBQ3077976.1 FAD-dependent oxidoreductase [Clostridia bacterium]
MNKIVIVGGVAGGASAAARIRRLDETAEIIMLERSGYVSYANCGLPYYVGGEITEEKKLTLQTPESFRARFNVDVRVRNEAVAIDTEKKEVTIKNLATGETYTECYDKLILSPGARPTRPPLPGMDDPDIYTLRTVEDTFTLRSFVTGRTPEHVVVVGGGYIGLEMAENLRRMGIAVTMLEMADHVIASFDYDMACEVHAYLRTKGIALRRSTAAEGFSREDGRLTVHLKGGEKLACDAVIMAVGVTPETTLAKEAGLELGVRGAIVVDDHMRTSAPDVYAVGDAVQVRHLVSGKPALLPLAGPANKQGRIAADNICGLDSVFDGSQGSSIVKIFDMTAAGTGLSEAAAKQAGIPCDKVFLYSPSHATYYPGATNMSIKVLFNTEDGKILGAQIVGFDGVDKRCDVLAAAIRAGMTAEDLAELELCYAPPFSSAKDPVNMAGFMIQNIRDGLVKQNHWHDMVNRPEDVVVLDVRTDGEFARGHIEGALHIPVDSLRGRIDELPKGKTLYVHCQSGLRSYVACRMLSQHGFDCYNLAGGYRFYDIVTRDREADLTPVHPCGVPV